MTNKSFKSVFRVTSTSECDSPSMPRQLLTHSINSNEQQSSIEENPDHTKIILRTYLPRWQLQHTPIPSRTLWISYTTATWYLGCTLFSIVLKSLVKHPKHAKINNQHLKKDNRVLFRLSFGKLPPRKMLQAMDTGQRMIPYDKEALRVVVPVFIIFRVENIQINLSYFSFSYVSTKNVQNRRCLTWAMILSSSKSRWWRFEGVFTTRLVPAWEVFVAQRATTLNLSNSLRCDDKTLTVAPNSFVASSSTAKFLYNLADLPSPASNAYPTKLPHFKFAQY